MLGLTDPIIESLQRQKDGQSSVRLLTRRMDRYDRLLDKYQQPPNLVTADGV